MSCIVSPQIEVFEPFTANTDASRTNMTSKQLLQSIVHENTETPYIINKNFKVITDLTTPYIKIADEDGVVLYNNNNLFIYWGLETKKLYTDDIPETKKMVNNSLTLKYIYNKSKFNKGDVLWDYTNISPDTKLPKIGYRANIMYSSFFGFNADDALVISESFAERARIDYTEKVFVPISNNLRFLKNPKTNKFFRSVGEITEENYFARYNILEQDNKKKLLSEAINLDQKNSFLFTKNIESIVNGEILSIKIHKLNKESFKSLNEKYIYSPGLLEELEELYKNQKITIDHLKKNLKPYLTLNGDEEADNIIKTIISNYITVNSFGKLFMTELADNFKINKDTIDFILEVEIYKDMPTGIGDKFANLFAGKGVVSMIVPDHLMPKDEKGDIADVIFNPLGLFGRNNWGTVFETASGKIIEEVEENISNKTQTIKRIKFINKNLIKLIDIEYYDKINNLITLLEDDQENYNMFKKDVMENGFYLFIDNFPKISYPDFLNNFVLEYEKSFKIKIDKKDKTIFSNELLEWLVNQGYESTMINKQNVKSLGDIQQDVQFGKNYFLKLFHTSWSKYNATSFSSSYSKNTGQPARGRKNKGGAHISWQTFASFVGYKKENAVMKEFYTIKTDVSISDKNQFSNIFLHDGSYNLKKKYTSHTKLTVNNSLKMIGMEFKSTN
jgi:DNA-directed RNA polymerase beta subunit